jgi:NADH dehydrogenase
MREKFGAGAAIRVVVIGAQDVIGPDLGPNPRPFVAEAFESLGVKAVLGSGVVSVDADGVHTASGTRIEASTVIWAGGMRASSLTAQVSSHLDQTGRVEVAADLRVPEAPDVFVAGDVARALTDDDGHYALMSCQHAIVMGQFGGYNVAADLLGTPTLPYRQPFYATCLDLGEWGAVYSEGWDRQIKLTHAEGKARKRMINTKWIYPPAPNRSEALSAGNRLRRSADLFTRGTRSSRFAIATLTYLFLNGAHHESPRTFADNPLFCNHPGDLAGRRGRRTIFCKGRRPQPWTVRE